MAEQRGPEDLDQKLDEASEAVDKQLQDEQDPQRDSIEQSHEMPADGQPAEGMDGRGVTARQDKDPQDSDRPKEDRDGAEG